MLEVLASLRRFDPDHVQLEELVAVAAMGKCIRAEFEARSIAAPEWLDERMRGLNRAIESHRRDALEMRLKEITARKTALMTPDEKRAALAAEEDEVRKQLAETSA